MGLETPVISNTDELKWKLIFDDVNYVRYLTM